MPYVHGYPEHNFAVFARDARENLTPNETQRTTLIVAGCYIVAIFVLWCVVRVRRCAAGGVLNIWMNVGMGAQAHAISIRY